MDMKKTLMIFSLVALLFSCGKPSGNNYMEKISGTIMPCVSGQPELFTVLGNIAVYDGRAYSVVLDFHKTIIASEEGETAEFLLCDSLAAEPLGTVAQTFKIDYTKGHKYVKSFSIDAPVCTDAAALREKVNQAVIIFKVDGSRITDADSADDFWTMAEWAFYFQNEFCRAIDEDDIAMFYSNDYGWSNFDGIPTEFASLQFNRASELWKAIYPQKWEQVKTYRKQRIEAGDELCITDLTAPFEEPLEEEPLEEDYPEEELIEEE